MTGIASLLPSATEICFALGLGERVVGVSHECDFPPAVAGLPVFTRSSIDSTAPSAEIHRQVRDQVLRGLSLYQVEEERLRELAPELIVTQDTCRVCAVSFEVVEEAVARLVGGAPRVLSLAPRTLGEVWEDFRRVGRATGSEAAADRLAEAAQQRLEEIAGRTAGLARPRVLALEWLDPPMAAGHWTPELLWRAGADPVLGPWGEPTRVTTWQAVAAAAPDLVLVLPCGFPVVQTLAELPAFLARPEVASLPAVRAGRVAVLDGNAYFNRPGPRLVRSAELAAAAIHPRVFAIEVAAAEPELCWPL